MTKESNVSDAMEPIRNAPPKVRKVIEEVIKLESDKLFQDKPHLKAEILKIVKEVVQ